MGVPVLGKIFPNQTFSDILKEQRSKVVDNAAKIVTRLESLTNAHPLFTVAAYLNQFVVASTKSLSDFDVSEKAVLEAHALEGVAKVNFRKAYEDSYHEACKLFGKDNAESLFPVITPSKPSASSKDDQVAEQYVPATV